MKLLCKKCLETKDLEEFYTVRENGARHNKDYYCKKCKKAIGKKKVKKEDLDGLYLYM